MIKLWHDDVRPAPEGWVWAKNNDEAKIFFARGDVVECSLDHDLGALPEHGIHAKGTSEDNGYKLVQWMIENECVPAKVTVHSRNPDAALRMARALDDMGYPVTIKPFVYKG